MPKLKQYRLILLYQPIMEFDKYRTSLYNKIRRVTDKPQKQGRIAQLGEHLPYKQRVTGSIPVVPTT